MKSKFDRKFDKRKSKIIKLALFNKNVLPYNNIFMLLLHIAELEGGLKPKAKLSTTEKMLIFSEEDPVAAANRSEFTRTAKRRV